MTQELFNKMFNFNPRSPCGERLGRQVSLMVSTSYFNPRSPCGERRIFPKRAFEKSYISIHAPRVGSDIEAHGDTVDGLKISIHAPRVGSDIEAHGDTVDGLKISIHAPRVGSDCSTGNDVPYKRYFNPRSPCGERQHVVDITVPSEDFNPRSPCGERPQTIRSERSEQNFNPRSPCGERLEAASDFAEVPDISIHAPRVGSDRNLLC